MVSIYRKFSMGAIGGEGESGRIGWVDTAKGIAIILVVLNHAVIFLVPVGLAQELWLMTNTFFQAFRMPLFFLAAGLFAGSAVARSWIGLWRTRLALLVWAYFLWTAIRFIYFLIFPYAGRAWETDPLLLLLSPVWPSTGLWFLHALVFFLVATKLMHGRIPPALQVAGAAILSTAMFAYPVIPNISYSGMATYFVFFLGGCHGRALVIGLASRTKPWIIVVSFVVFFSLSVATGLLDLPRAILFLVAVIALIFGVSLSVVLNRFAIFGWVAALGRQTLGVYVSHVILIVVLITGLNALNAQMWPLFIWISPILVAASVVALAVVLRRLARGNVLDYAYTAPSWFRGSCRDDPAQKMKAH